MMKKFLFSGIAMLAFCMAFVACSNTDVYDENAEDNLKQEQRMAKYTAAFIEAFGQIAPGNDWGFNRTNLTRANITRGAASDNFNQYYNNGEGDGWDFSWIPPGQGKKFINEFNKASASTDKYIDFSDYFVQQISMQTGKGQGGNGTNAQKVHMDKIQAYNYQTGQWEDVPGFSKGMNTSTQTDYQHNTLTKGVALMVNMGTPTESQRSLPQFRWISNGTGNGALPKGTAVDNYVIKKIGDDIYLGFGYTNDNKSDYDAWIVRLVKAQGNPGYKACGRVMCEDLGATTPSDMDFNDVVFDAYILNDGSVNIQVLAAGGELRPVYVAGQEVTLPAMSNTGWKDINAPIQKFTLTKEQASALNITSIGTIPVEVTGADGIRYSLDNYVDKAPSKICTLIGVDWALERTKLVLAYPNFATYVNSLNPKDWQEDEVSNYVYSYTNVLP